MNLVAWKVKEKEAAAEYRTARQERMERCWQRFCFHAIVEGLATAERLERCQSDGGRRELMRRLIPRLAGWRFASALEEADLGPAGGRMSHPAPGHLRRVVQFHPVRPARSIEDPPGSLGRVLAYADRLAAGEEIFSDCDAEGCGRLD